MKRIVMVGMVVLLAVIVIAPASFAGITMLRPSEVSRFYSGRSHNFASRGNDRGYRSSGRNSSDRCDNTELSVGARTKIGNTEIDLGFLNQVIKSSSNRGGSKPTVVVVEKPVLVQPAPTQATTVTEPVKPEMVRYSVTIEKTNEPVGALEFPKSTDLQKILAIGNHVKYSRGGTFLAEYEIVRVTGLFIYVNALAEPGGKPQSNDDFTIVAAQ